MTALPPEVNAVLFVMIIVSALPDVSPRRWRWVVVRLQRHRSWFRRDYRRLAFRNDDHRHTLISPVTPSTSPHIKIDVSNEPVFNPNLPSPPPPPPPPPPVPPPPSIDTVFGPLVLSVSDALDGIIVSIGDVKVSITNNYASRHVHVQLLDNMSASLTSVVDSAISLSLLMQSATTSIPSEVQLLLESLMIQCPLVQSELVLVLSSINIKRKQDRTGRKQDRSNRHQTGRTGKKRKQDRSNRHQTGRDQTGRTGKKQDRSNRDQTTRDRTEMKQDNSVRDRELLLRSEIISWPTDPLTAIPIVTRDTKRQCLSLFIQATSATALKLGVCTVCHHRCLRADLTSCNMEDLDLSRLQDADRFYTVTLRPLTSLYFYRYPVSIFTAVSYTDLMN